MLTWRLWRALRYPDEGNPLFERVQAQLIAFPGLRLLRRISPLFQIFSLILPLIVIVVAPLALLAVSNLLGALAAFNVMHTINGERQRRTYDLLALLPMGLARANWQIAAGCVERIQAVERLAQIRTLAMTPLVLLIFYTFRSDTSFSPITVVIVLVALNLDAIQSLITGCLSGMLAQVFSEQGAPFAALAIFAFVQVIGVYLPVTVVTVLLIDFLLPTGQERWIVELIVGVVGLALLFALREVVIQVMWRALERRLL